MRNRTNQYIWFIVLGFISIQAVGATTKTTDNSDSMENTFIVVNKRLRFARRPELGYVLRTQKETAITQAQPSDQIQAGITGRPRMKVVCGQQLFSENDKMIESLSIQSQIEYIAPLFSSNGETIAIIPEIVVRLKNILPYNEMSSLSADTNCTIIRRLDFSKPLYYLLAPKAQNADDVFATVQQLNESESVEWAVPNVAFQPKLCGQIIPNDEYFADQWHLHNTGQSGGTANADINAPEAWELTTGDPNIVVAVLDSGVDSNHPDLINNLVRGYDFCDNDYSPDPTLGESTMNAHGTACAGLIAAQANNSIGVAGVAPRCKIMPIRIFRAKGKYSVEWVTEATIAEAIMWAAQNGADIVSLSYSSHLYSTIIREAIISVTVPGGVGRNGKGCVVLAGAEPEPNGARVNMGAYGGTEEASKSLME